MKLERLVLTNFRQYYKRQLLEFSKSSQRHVTVIHGINGAGKTSMFLALNWCLYGREVIDNVGELICKEALAQAQIGDLVEMSVELTFTHDGQRYVMKRTASARANLTVKSQRMNMMRWFSTASAWMANGKRRRVRCR